MCEKQDIWIRNNIHV